MNHATLAELRAAWLAAKEAEARANAERRAIEDAIIALMPAGASEGTVTDKEHGVSVTYKAIRKADTERLQEHWMELPDNVRAAFRWKADVDTKHLRALHDLDATGYAAAAAYITTTPAKPAITIKDA